MQFHCIIFSLDPDFESMVKTQFGTMIFSLQIREVRRHVPLIPHSLNFHFLIFHSLNFLLAFKRILRTSYSIQIYSATETKICNAMFSRIFFGANIFSFCEFFLLFLPNIFSFRALFLLEQKEQNVKSFERSSSHSVFTIF